MFDGQRSSIAFGARLLFFFLLFSFVSPWTFAFYAPLVTWSAGALWNAMRASDVSLTIIQSFPEVMWQASWTDHAVEESISFYLISYNAILFGSLVAGYPGWPWRRRGLLLLTGMPFIATCHVLDLILAIENRLLTLRGAGHYRMLADFDLWFSFVKYAYSLSVFAGKQVFPILLLLVQCRLLPKWDPLAPR